MQSTLAQDISSADVAVVARLVAMPPPTESKDGELNVAPPIAKFAVIEVLKGTAALGSAKQVKAPFFDDKPLGGRYLILGQQPPAIVWAPPTLLTPRSRQYISRSSSSRRAASSASPSTRNISTTKRICSVATRSTNSRWLPIPYLQKLKSRMHHDVIVEQDPRIRTSLPAIAGSI